jgi:CcmD family protein
MDVMKYLYIAFGIVWIVFIAYILNLFRLRRALNSELDVLERLK